MPRPTVLACEAASTLVAGATHTAPSRSERRVQGDSAHGKVTLQSPFGAAIAVVRQPDGAPALAVGAPGTQAGSGLDAGAVWLWTAETLRSR